MLLTLLIAAFVRSEGADRFRLPRTRTEFYERIVDMLLVTRPSERQSAVDADIVSVKRNALRTVARRRFDRRVNPDQRERLDSKLLADALEACLVEVGRPRDLNAQCLIREMEREDGILVRVETHRRERAIAYSFPHRSLLEYFAACELRATVSPERYVTQLKYADVEDFFEVGRWFCALPGLDADSEEPVTVFARHYLERTPIRPSKAALCLIAAQDSVSDGPAVAQVTEALQLRALTPEGQGIEADAALLLLAELAMNDREIFDCARTAYQECVHVMLGGGVEQQSVEQIRRLAVANPEATIRLIQTVLRGPDSPWQGVLVAALEQLNTEESMVTLVGLLALPIGSNCRTFAAASLCRLLASGDAKRLSVLKRCRRAFPTIDEPVDVWPFHKEFDPGIAMPLIHSFPAPAEPPPRPPLIRDAVQLALGRIRGENATGSSRQRPGRADDVKKCGQAVVSLPRNAFDADRGSCSETSSERIIQEAESLEQ